MHEIEHKIWVDDYCFQNELSLMKDDTVSVIFQYYNKKRDKEGKAIPKNFIVKRWSLLVIGREMADIKL